MKLNFSSDRTDDKAQDATRVAKKRKLSTDMVDNMDRETCEEYMNLIGARLKRLHQIELEKIEEEAERSFQVDKLVKDHGYTTWTKGEPIFHGKRNLKVQGMYQGQPVTVKQTFDTLGISELSFFKADFAYPVLRLSTTNNILRHQILQKIVQDEVIYLFSANDIATNSRSVKLIIKGEEQVLLNIILSRLYYGFEPIAHRFLAFAESTRFPRDNYDSDKEEPEAVDMRSVEVDDCYPFTKEQRLLICQKVTPALRHALLHDAAFVAIFAQFWKNPRNSVKCEKRKTTHGREAIVVLLKKDAYWKIVTFLYENLPKDCPGRLDVTELFLSGSILCG